MGVSNIKEGMIYPTDRCGYLKVIKYNSKYDIDVEFVNTGGKRNISAQTLRKGQVKDSLVKTLYDVGYVGYGVYHTRLDDGSGKNTAYKYWSRMLKRCYSEICPDYCNYGGAGVTVATEWHNFQNFAEWFYSQKNCKVKGIHLDKDLTRIGNKVYCKELCYLVPPRVNTLGVDRKTAGVSWHQAGKKWVTHLEKGKAVRSKDATYLIALYERYKRNHVYSVLQEEYSAGNISSEILRSVYNHVNYEYNTISHKDVAKSSTDSIRILFTLQGGLLGGSYE